MVQQYWWVNQTENHRIEREKGVVAGEIRKTNIEKTTWGRANVKKMEKGNFLVCYRSRIGIDRLAYVTEDGAPGPAPWGDCGDREAYIANVKYLTIKPIKREDFWDDLKDIASYRNGPLILSTHRIRFAYAMKLERDGFNVITGFAKRANPGKVENWMQEVQKS